VLTDPDGAALAHLTWAPSPGETTVESAGLPAAVEVRRSGTGELLGRLEVRLAPEALLSGWNEWAARTGGVLGVLDGRDGRPLVGGPFDPNLLLEERFVLGGEEWITDRRPLVTPSVVLVLASPLEPFTLPFREAARRGMLLILVVGVGGFAAAMLLTVRTTRSMTKLATAAEAVARGDLETRVTPEGPEEVARAARAFNDMAESLSATLDTLSKREALAAVGEFASALAHELRNPLTAIRLDLQRIEEVSGDEQRRAVLTERLLAAARQLDRTVEGVLRVAGMRGTRREPVNLAEPLERAARTARSTFEARGAELVMPAARALPGVEGDSPALEQLFLNLLVNAAEAVGEGGRATVQVREEADRVTITISDTGPGIPDDLRERVLEPLFTTKVRGTGLGLAIADRIARAHGGQLELGNDPGGGARAQVRLPAAGGAA
jgi:signal transduction histidine kinase